MQNRTTEQLVTDRGAAYGHPCEDFKGTAELWTSYLKRRGKLAEDMTITMFDIPLLMILLKINREANKHGDDNLADIKGYAKTAEMLWE